MRSAPVSSRVRQPAFWAAAAPLLCAVHCAAAPVLVAVLPSLGVSEGVERVLMALSAALAAGFAISGIRSHGRAVVLLPLAAGLLLWVTGSLDLLPVLPEAVAHAAGGALMAAGMLWNANLRHRAACRGCGCPAHVK